MQRRATFIAVALILITSLLTTILATAQNAPASTNSERKVTTRVAPDYPELARKMHLQGIVKVEAVVRTNGSVKSTRALGGNPVFVGAATDAVAKWKFDPGPNETTEVVQLTFVPK